MIFIIGDIRAFINIPQEIVDDATWLFAFTFASFSLSLVQAVYTTPIYSLNRLDYIQSINIKRALIRVVLIVSLFSLDEPLLKYVGMANFSAALFVFVQTIYLSKKLVPQLLFNLTLFEKNRIKNIFSMGWWVLVQQVGGLLFLKVDLYIINTYIDAYEAGRYAIVIQINTIIRMMIGVFASVASPIIMIYYAKNETEKLIKLSKFAVKGLGILLSILIGFLCGIGGDLLSLWLDESFRTLETLLFLSLAPLVINLAMLPLFTINTAFNRVKFPGIITLLLGFVNIILSIILVTKTDFGIYGVIISGILLLSMKNIIFTPLYSSHILKIPKITFFKPLVTTIITFVFVYALTITISFLINPSTILSLILIFVLVIMVSFIFISYLVFSIQDKVLLWDIVPISIKLKLKKIKSRIQNA
jgi:membrane protein EpsK